MRRLAIVAVFCSLCIVAVPTVSAEGGRVERMSVSSAVYGASMDVHVFLPPDFDPARPHTVIYTPSGDLYLREGSPARRWLESTASRAPIVLVSLPFPADDVASSTALSRLETAEAEDYARFVGTEVVPAVEQRHRLSATRESRLLMGFSAGSVLALDVAIAQSDRFGAIAAQSPGWMIWDPAQNAISEDYSEVALARLHARCEKLHGLWAWFVWGDSTEDEWERRSREANGPRVIGALRACGVEVTVAPAVSGGHGLQLIDKSLPAAVAFLESAAARQRPIGARSDLRE